jgi:hypothetical protein
MMTKHCQKQPDHPTILHALPYESLIRLRAAYMPDVARAVFRTAPDLIPEARRPSGFDIIFGLSTRPQQFAFARLSGSALAVDRDLPGPVAGSQIAPAQARDLGDAQARAVEQGQERPIAGVRLQADHQQGVGLAQDALGERVLDGRGFEHLAEVDAQIADSWAKENRLLRAAVALARVAGAAACRLSR